MKGWVTTGPAKLLAGLILAGLAATWAVGKVLGQHEDARPTMKEVGKMSEKMKTICVGRFLIDMPEEAHVELARARIQGFDITAFDESTAEFAARLANRQTEIQSKPNRNGGNKNLELIREVQTKTGLTGKIFVHSRSVTEGTAANGLEIENYRYEGVAVEALVHGDGVSIDVSSDYYFPDKLEDLFRLVAQLVPNPGNHLPHEAGFCIDRAYVRDPLTADQLEQISMFAKLPSHPDVDFMLLLAAGLEPDEDGLLERGAAAEGRLSILERFRVTRLRAAAREINGLAGEELVRRAVEENDAQVYSFWWEVNGTNNDVLTPHLVFTMTTGKSRDGPIPTSMSEDAALGLWDRIASSIRVRRVEQEQSTPTNHPTAQIGTEAWAGDRCPVSGWWLCGEGGNGVNVLGGQRQYIRAGERMPQALLLLPQSLWERLRGLQPSIESKERTSWKLVDARARKRTPPSLPLANAKAATAENALSAALSNHDDLGKRPSIGSYSSTGSPCPASGWWRCEESHALDGTRWFAQGSLLPPATFTVAPGIFGHSPGAPQAIQRRSAWRLVRLANAPENGNRYTLDVVDDMPPVNRRA